MTDATPPSYMLCATPRSGTTLLCDLLEQTGVAGRPNSFYRWQSISKFIAKWGAGIAPPHVGETFERAYLDIVRREGRAGTGQFGIRVMWPSLPEMLVRFAPLFPATSPGRERLEAAFGPMRYLFVSRGDKVAQAVSRVHAEQTGLWHRHADGSERERTAPPVAPRYDAAAIKGFVEEALAHEHNWRNWFAANGIEPFVVSYEQLAAAPRESLADILVALGHDPASAAGVEIRTARLSDALNAEWAERYRRETA